MIEDDRSRPDPSRIAALRAGAAPGRVLVAALCGVVGLCGGAAARPAGPSPLTNEDVVRMVMTGTAEKQIVAAIDSRPVDFDLSIEMQQELRQAGVNDRILETMRRRQAAMPRAEPSATPVPAAARTGTIRVEFDPGGGGSPWERSAIALEKLPQGVSRRGGVEVGEMTDMALAVLCATADHVPDHWDTRSPLHGAPRHELLLFRPGSATDKAKGHEILYLDHQPAYEVQVPEGTHSIVVAAAGKQTGSGTWRLLESDGARVTVLPGRTTRLVLQARSRIRGSTMLGFAVDSDWKVLSVEVLEQGAQTPAAAAAPTPQEGRP
ncbi:MAG: hypothetical protein DMF51_01665 [Acidobacteria bacterium]|nr:MAG: hypothetical protein DMF51_01665 [Acidobacteriota bacterium]